MSKKIILLFLTISCFLTIFWFSRKSQDSSVSSIDPTQSSPQSVLPVAPTPTTSENTVISQSPKNPTPPSSLQQSFAEQALSSSQNKIPSFLKKHVTNKVINSGDDFVIVAWSLDGINIEGSEERWIWDKFQRKVSSQFESPLFEKLNSQSVLEFPRISDQEILDLVIKTLDLEHATLKSMIAKAQPLWITGDSNNLIPVYELQMNIEKNRTPLMEVWRIHAIDKKIIRRSPQSRHGSAEDRGIKRKSENSLSF